MVNILARRRDSVNTELDPEATTAYIDTVEIFFPYWAPRADIERIGRLKECRDWGYRLILNQPSQQELLSADEAARKYRGVLSRFDLAIDVQLPSAASPKAANTLKDLIARTALLRWRRRRQMEDTENVVYWLRRARYRNLVLYADKPNRFTGELNCVHLELRFLKPKAVRSQVITRVRELISVNPRELFERHVKFSEVAEKHFLRVLRATVKADIASHRKLPKKERSKFIEAYEERERINLRGWVKQHLNRTGEDRAQIVRDKLKKRKQVEASKSPLIVPTYLSWPYQEKQEWKSRRNPGDGVEAGNITRKPRKGGVRECGIVDVPGEFELGGGNGRLTTMKV